MGMSMRQIRLTDEERARLESAAQRYGVGLGEMVRRLAALYASGNVSDAPPRRKGRKVLSFLVDAEEHAAFVRKARRHGTTNVGALMRTLDHVEDFGDG